MDELFSSVTNKAGFESLLKEAQNGSADAQYRIGRMYETGRYFPDLWVPQDTQNGLKYLRHSAKQGHVLAADYIEAYERDLWKPPPTRLQLVAAFLKNHLLGIFMWSAAASLLPSIIWEYVHNTGADGRALEMAGRLLRWLADWLLEYLPR